MCLYLRDARKAAWLGWLCAGGARIGFVTQTAMILLNMRLTRVP